MNDDIKDRLNILALTKVLKGEEFAEEFKNEVLFEENNTFTQKKAVDMVNRHLLKSGVLGASAFADYDKNEACENGIVVSVDYKDILVHITLDRAEF